MVALGKGLQRAFPADLRFEFTFVVEAVGTVIELGQFRADRAEMGIDIDRAVCGEHRPDETVPFLIGQFDQAVVVA